MCEELKEDDGCSFSSKAKAAEESMGFGDLASQRSRRLSGSKPNPPPENRKMSCF